MTPHPAAAALVALAVLAACADETVAGYADPGPWHLVEVDGVAAAPGTTLLLGRGGRVEGALPCGSYSARQTAPYPWFALAGVTVAAAGCPAPPAGERIVRDIAAMTLAEVQGPVLILSDADGRSLVFRSGG